VYTPFNIAVQPKSTNGEFVYSFSVTDAGTGTNPIEGYQLDPTTGKLTALTSSPFTLSTTTAFGQFDQSGSYLFLYSGVAPTIKLGVANVSTAGGLAETLPTASVPTSGYWAVSDVP
jgi:hypothetical protein